ncbi:MULTISPECIES: MFS transporter [unclassified Crossiella]|uniref:MFS transporter n=1 Tax=unclassified Crossiella TaxID=2620835 RepID=UPI001FFFB04C|nr:MULTISPECIES: MFS transporter [unclassified Crossiella]MCK2239642.1 MFS transporter [Crossiella sp. S99.2]MCK2252337.1 MFS transporter [Crossiella sp. S99.1]
MTTLREPATRTGLLTTVLAFTALVTLLTHTMLIPVLPGLPERLGTSPATTSWLVTVTVVVGAVANPLLGRLADLFGRKRVLLLAVLAFLLGSLLCALTADLTLLIVGRAIQGLSTVAIPLGISLIAALVPPERRAGGIALVSAMLGIGGAVALPLAGLVADVWGFHGLFWVCFLAGLPALAAVWWLVPEVPTNGERAPVDLVGATLLVLALTALLLPLSRGAEWGWDSPLTLGLLGAAALGLAVFGLVELRRRAPIVDLRLAARASVLLTNLSAFLTGFALFVNFLGTVTVLQTRYELSVVLSGLCMLPGGLLMAALSPVAARLITRRGGRFTLLIGTAGVVLGFALRLAMDSSLWHVVLATTVISGGAGLAYSAMPALILDATPPAQAAAANGLNSLARTLGSSVASAVFGALAAAGGLPLFFVLGTITAVLATLVVAMPVRPRPDIS